MPALQDQYTGAACLGHATFLQIIFFFFLLVFMDEGGGSTKKTRMHLVFCHCQANALGYSFKQRHLNSLAISTIWGSLRYVPYIRVIQKVNGNVVASKSVKNIL